MLEKYQMFLIFFYQLLHLSFYFVRDVQNIGSMEVLEI